MKLKSVYSFLAAALLLVGCASNQTVSPDLPFTLPATAGGNAEAKWVFSSRTTWGDPARITIYINGYPLTGVVELNPDDFIGTYQGHVVRAQCTTEWKKGAAFGSGSCYVFVDGTQAGILLL